MIHLLAAIVFVSSITAVAYVGVATVNDLLDELAYRRAVRRRLRIFTQVR